MPIPWNKNKTGVYSEETLQQIRDTRAKQVFSEESNKKRAASHIGKHPSINTINKISKAITEWHKTHISPVLGKPHSQQIRKRIGDAQKGEKNHRWNKHNSEKQKNAVKIALSGISRSEEVKQKIKNTKREHPFYPSIEIKSKESEAGKIRWKNPEYAKMMAEKLNLKPNDEELYLDAILQLNYPNTWKYVGDNAFGIEGKYPDWIHIQGEKAVIEYNGFRIKDKADITYGHTNEKDIAKTEHYQKYGYKTINIYKEDLDHPEKIIKKVKKAMASKLIEEQREEETNKVITPYTIRKRIRARG